MSLTVLRADTAPLPGYISTLGAGGDRVRLIANGAGLLNLTVLDGYITQASVTSVTNISDSTAFDVRAFYGPTLNRIYVDGIKEGVDAIQSDRNESLVGIERPSGRTEGHGSKTMMRGSINGMIWYAKPNK